MSDDDQARRDATLRVGRLVVDAAREIQRTLHGSPTAWFGAPLAGVAAGADPLFLAFRQHVGPSHWTPLEAFTHAFPGTDATPDELAVISWILPHSEETRRANRTQAALPAERWALGKATGEAVNTALRRRVVDLLAEADVAAVAPVLLPQWTSAALVSVWSERHIAYAAGLGTFGLCDGLITPLGKAMRCGSVVARAALAPTPRPYVDHHAYCLAYAGHDCRVCAERCPAGAITDEGHDKLVCLAYLDDVERDYLRPRFGIATHACGLCQTGVPCESRIPVRAAEGAEAAGAATDRRHTCPES